MKNVMKKFSWMNYNLELNTSLKAERTAFRDLEVFFVPLLIYSLRVKISYWFHRLERWNQYRINLYTEKL